MYKPSTSCKDEVIQNFALILKNSGEIFWNWFDKLENNNLWQYISTISKY